MSSARFLYFLTLGAALFWCSGILLAPSVSDTSAGRLLYSFYGTVCHQIPGRSLHLVDTPLAVCARCFGVYAGFLAGAVAGLLPVARFLASVYPRALVVTAMIPMLVDVFLASSGLHESTMLSRLITGLWFGTLAAPVVLLLAVEGFCELLAMKGYNHV